MSDDKLIKFYIPENYHVAVSEAAGRIHGTVPQMFKMAMDAYLRTMGVVVPERADNG